MRNWMKSRNGWNRERQKCPCEIRFRRFRSWWIIWSQRKIHCTSSLLSEVRDRFICHYLFHIFFWVLIFVCKSLPGKNKLELYVYIQLKTKWQKQQNDGKWFDCFSFVITLNMSASVKWKQVKLWRNLFKVNWTRAFQRYPIRVDIFDNNHPHYPYPIGLS